MLIPLHQIILKLSSLLHFQASRGVFIRSPTLSSLNVLDMNYRERLVEFYQKHNPLKLNEVDSLLRTFAGREDSMFAALQAKYEGKPASTVDDAPRWSDSEAAQRERDQLINEMNAVNIDRLLTQLKGRPTVEGDLLVHTLTFLQHFASCARRFKEISCISTRADAAMQTDEAGQCEMATQTVLVPTDPVKAVAVAAMPTDSAESIDAPEPPVPPVAPAPSMPSVLAGSVPPDPPLPSAPPTLAALRDSFLVHRPSAVHCVQPKVHLHAAVIGPLLAQGVVRSGDSVVLQPGVYHENIVLLDAGEIEFVAAFPGAAVILKPLCDLEPIIRAGGPATQLRVSGLVLVEDEAAATRADPSAPNKPLAEVAGGASVTFDGCHFYEGSCGVEAHDVHTNMRMHLCVISSSGFAGVFAHHGVEVILTQCKIKQCDAGIRVASKSSIHLRETVIEENTTDGIVSYEGASGLLERCSVLRNGGNGVFLAAASALVVMETTIELNGLYGVQRFQGSSLHLCDSVVRDNALLPINDTDGTDDT